MSGCKQELNKNECLHRRSSTYDRYYCNACDVWTEGLCGDKDCSYCVSEEEDKKPSEVMKVKKHFNLSLGFTGDLEASEKLEELIETDEFHELLDRLGVKISGWYFGEL